MAQHLTKPCALRSLRRVSQPWQKPYSTTPSPATPSEAEIQSAQTYCTNLLKKYDTPSHTLLAFIPPPTRPAYLALRALNLEIAHIPDTTTTPHIASMRYSFWHSQLSLAFTSTPSKHPVSILLAHALSDLDARTAGAATLSKAFLTRTISAREAYSGGRAYTTLDALEKYAEDTYSTLLYLTLQALPVASVEADHIASHVGKAMGITSVLRGVPLLAFPGAGRHHSTSAAAAGGGGGNGGGWRGGQQEGVVALPLDVMARAGMREEDVLRMGAGAGGVRDAVFEVAVRASDHLITAREMLRAAMVGEGGKEERRRREVGGAFGVFMPAVAVQLWLDRLQGVDFDVFREEVRGREWRLGWKAYWAFRRKMF